MREVRLHEQLSISNHLHHDHIIIPFAALNIVTVLIIVFSRLRMVRKASVDIWQVPLLRAMNMNGVCKVISFSLFDVPLKHIYYLAACKSSGIVCK